MRDYCTTCARTHKDPWVPRWRRESNDPSYPKGFCTLRTWQEHVFKYGKLRPVRFEADVWKNMHDVTIPINQMTEARLKVAIGFIEKGYRVYGQRSKEISLRKALAKLENGQ